MNRQRYEIVICPTCMSKVEIRKGHEERDMQEHMLEHRWSTEGIIGEAIWGR